DVKDLISDSYIIAHNVPFDVGFLNHAFQDAGYEGVNNPVLDTVELSRILYPQAPSYKLGRLSSYLGIEHVDPHRALSDALITAHVFLLILQKIKQLPYETITHLLNLEKALTSDLSEILMKEQENLAFSKVDECKIDSNPIDVSFGDYLDAVYGPDGSMQTQMESYEERSGQRTMSESVYDSFASRKHALIESETGTGKSLAYLLPVVH